jgi:prepilin-type N-terminal cleavage/methylation domain-containing protein
MNHQPRGYSLIEVMFTLALLAIIATPLFLTVQTRGDEYSLFIKNKAILASISELERKSSQPYESLKPGQVILPIKLDAFSGLMQITTSENNKSKTITVKTSWKERQAEASVVVSRIYVHE